MRREAKTYRIHKVGVAINHLHLLQGDVFTALQLDKVLLTVDDPDATVRQELPDITRVEPTIIGERLLRLVGHHVVPARQAYTTDTNFTTSEDFVPLHVIPVAGEVRLSGLVTNIWRRFELHLNRRNRWTNDAIAKIVRFLDRKTGASLRQTLYISRKRKEGEFVFLRFGASNIQAGRAFRDFAHLHIPVRTGCRRRHG